MDLTILKLYDTRNTTIANSEGTPVYRVSTPSCGLLKNPDSTICRVDDGEDRAFASIRWDGLTKAAAVTIRGHRVQMHHSRMLSMSEIFMASDGEMYKWKVSISGKPKLVRNDSKAVIATYSGAPGIFTRRPSVLSVTPEGVPILDDIVVTFIYVETRRREQEVIAATGT